MATSSAAAAAAGFVFGFLPPVTKKLTHDNYSMWHA